jgi:hypothetical protein
MFEFLVLIIVAVIIIIFGKNASNLKNAHLDFLKEMFAIAGTGLLATFWTNTFFRIVNNYPPSSSTWFLEVWVLAFIILSIIIGWLIRSLFTTSISIILLGLFISAEIWKWGFDSTTRIAGEGSVTPLATIGLSWIMVNFTYILGKYLSRTVNLHRVGNILRLVALTGNVIFLGILSNSFAITYGLSFIISGNSLFGSWPLILVTLAFIVFTVLIFAYEFKSGLKPFEISLSFLPGFVLVFFGLASYGQISLESNGVLNNPLMIIWAVIFNILYLSYLFYLLYKSNKTKEFWLKGYTIFLIVIVFIERIVDVGLSLSFNGIFLTIFGVLVLGIIGGVQYYKSLKLKK